MTDVDPTPPGRPAAKRYVVAAAEDVPEGGRILVEAGGRSIGIFRIDGRYYGLLNRCPHAGAELCRGKLLGRLESDRPGEYRYDTTRKLLVCPWHGWEFDVTTGQSYFDPRRTRARAYGVAVESADAVRNELASGAAEVPADADAPPAGLVEGPYRAERVQLEVEGDYLVVSLAAFRPEST